MKIPLKQSSPTGFGSQPSNGVVPLVTSTPCAKPSPSVSILQPGEAFGGSHGSNGSVPAVTSSPSLIPSPSVSGLVGLVPSVASSAFVNPSPSWSQGPAFGFGIHGSVFAGSVSSFTPSLSASKNDESNGSIIPSPSVSIGFAGSAPVSTPSLSPSPSVSGLFGSVPLATSSTFKTPSPSRSGLSATNTATTFSGPASCIALVSSPMACSIGPVVYSQ